MSRVGEAEVDGLIAAVVDEVARRMTALGLPCELLRERQHLDPITKDVFETLTATRPTARTLRTPDFRGLGPVDVVHGAPPLLAELKWSYEPPGKLFESAWDAVKLALLGPAHGVGGLYLMTGASCEEWERSESADLFASGELDPCEFWSRPLVPPRGPNRGATIAEDLLIGAGGNRPVHMPARIVTRRVAACRVADRCELRAVGLVPAGPLVAWRAPSEMASPVPRPVGPAPVALDERGRFVLPARVTQAWIERTAPALDAALVGPFLRALRERGWSEDELAARVRPHLVRPAG